MGLFAINPLGIIAKNNKPVKTQYRIFVVFGENSKKLRSGIFVIFGKEVII
jgi:hypothetical protein